MYLYRSDFLAIAVSFFQAALALSGQQGAYKTMYKKRKFFLHKSKRTVIWANRYVTTVATTLSATVLLTTSFSQA